MHAFGGREGIQEWATMMNVVALAMLLFSLGSVMVLSPEPMLGRSSEGGESSLGAVKEAAQGTLLKAEETVTAAKDSVVRGVEGVTKPVETTLGWFKKKPKPEDRLAAAREKEADARGAFQEASAQLKDATVEKFGSAAEVAKDKAADALHATGMKNRAFSCTTMPLSWSYTPMQIWRGLWV